MCENIIQAREAMFQHDDIDREAMPFRIHSSHRRVIFCGGIVGCEECGKYASSDTRKNGLKKECRKNCPAGTRAQISRLRAGRNPQLGRKDERWPDGSVDPVPKRVRR